MKERNVRYQDVTHAIYGANHCEPYPDGGVNAWRVIGEDLDGDGLALGIAIEQGITNAFDLTIVVTVLESGGSEHAV
jgi:hypothetical protein